MFMKNLPRDKFQIKSFVLVMEALEINLKERAMTHDGAVKRYVCDSNCDRMLMGNII
jgi:hypothetical protein